MRKSLLTAVIGVAVVMTGVAQTPGPKAPDPAKEKRLEWFREAKYGMFIHWGLYAIPAGDWHGRRCLGLGEWLMNRCQVAVKEYEQLASQFNPVKYNPDEWVQLAQDAGMKYMVITSKHHDGFALFKSTASRRRGKFMRLIIFRPHHRRDGSRSRSIWSNRAFSSSYLARSASRAWFASTRRASSVARLTPSCLS